MSALALLKGIASPVTQIIKGRQEIKAAKVKSIIESIERGEESDITLDEEAMNRAGWMDDLSFFIFLLPAVLSFYPPALPHIMAGFEALEVMPQWWQMSLGLMLISVWGYRKLISPIITSLAKAYTGKLK